MMIDSRRFCIQILALLSVLGVGVQLGSSWCGRSPTGLPRWSSTAEVVHEVPLVTHDAGEAPLPRGVLPENNLPAYLNVSGSSDAFTYGKQRRAAAMANPKSWLRTPHTELKCAAIHALRANEWEPTAMWKALDASKALELTVGGKYYPGHLWAGGRVDLILAALYRLIDLNLKVKPGFIAPRRSYLDVAAAFPEAISNTMMLDACFGWAGVCVEADALKQPALHAQRSCIVAETCVHERDGIEVNFESVRGNDVQRGLAGMSGLSSLSNSGQALLKTTMTCRTLTTVARETGLNLNLNNNDINNAAAGVQRRTNVDVMSLDIEGAEHFALRGIDWSKLSIGVIVLEINDAHRVNSATGVVPKSGMQTAEALTAGGYVPLFGVFSFRGGIPLSKCFGVAIGYTPLDIFTHARWTTKLARYRTTDVFFAKKNSEVYAAAMSYIKSAGCDVSSKPTDGARV